MNDQLKELATKKNIASLLVIGILILAIPLGVRLIRYQQLVSIFAAEPSVNFVSPNVETREGKLVATSATVGVTLTPPWAPVSSGNGSPSPSGSQTPSPSSSTTPTPSPSSQAPLWNLLGAYDYTSSVTSCGTSENCVVGGKSKYIMEVTIMDTATGAFQGFFYLPGESVTDAFAQFKGTLIGSNLTLNYMEKEDPEGLRYTARFRGSVNSDGSLTGETLDSDTVKFQWRTTSGAATKL